MKSRKPFNTIRNKLMLLLLAATILPIATSMIISYNATTGSITEEAIAKNNRLLSLGKTNIMNYMSNINQKSLAVYNSMNVPRSLYYILERSLEDEVFPNDLTDVINNRNLLKDHLYSIYQSVSEFNKVRLYVVKQNATYLLWNDDIKVGENDKDTLAATVKKASIEPTHQSHNYGLNIKFGDVNDEMVFTLHRPIFRAPSEELLAELSIDVRLTVLEDLNRQLYDGGKEDFYIVDANGQIVLASNKEEIGSKIDQTWMNGIYSSSEDSGHFDWAEQSFEGMIFYDRIKTPYMDWYLVKQTPYSHLYSAADRVARINIWVGAAFLAIVVIATLFISFTFTKPLLRLIGYVNKIETGNLNVSIDIQSNDEIGLLARRFRSMMQTINNLILTEYRLEIANKTNQLKALQAQVNPHFLYNALQSIGTVSLQHGDHKAYGLITSLGKMMRYHMNTMDSVVELNRELEYAQAYLDLQKQRFDTALGIRLQIDDQTRRILVPKMILQPLLENFFKHGFAGADSPSELTIASSLSDDGRLLTIRVQDNGIGISDERLAELRYGLDKPPPHGVVNSQTQSPLPSSSSASVAVSSQEAGGIGLQNVLSRLRLHFHPSAAIELEQVRPHGFSVTIHIPLGEGE
ncbi:cache domain-containing sensor histidine kinase [Paenibacillus harenae]|uniref:Two-component system sensor histidine kinase YesM n=1 Tax=Paenibacillus harenae TaxID=306543 RepID=A0ABT9U1F1_PAEHA|nr:sensor histidine kinase [Paenibacillus harenae]MDQ0113476.1 two-component system sensor histidine kinase YesM [Paenibacillus harenae]